MSRTAGPLLIGLALPTCAFAHHVCSEPTPFIAGLVHPMLGLEHVVAATGLGVWAAVALGRRAVEILGVYLLWIALGTALGTAAPDLPEVTPITAGGVIGLGVLLTAGGGRWPLCLVVVAAVLGALHGIGCGMTAAPCGPGVWFAGGAVIGIALLFAIGAALAAVLRDGVPAEWLRSWGAATAVVGVLLLVTA